MWMKMYNPFYDHPGCKWFINILTNMLCNSPILRHIPLIKVKTTTYNHHLASGINHRSIVQKKYPNPKLLTIISIHFHYRTFHQCTPKPRHPRKKRVGKMIVSFWGSLDFFKGGTENFRGVVMTILAPTFGPIFPFCQRPNSVFFAKAPCCDLTANHLGRVWINDETQWFILL